MPAYKYKSEEQHQKHLAYRREHYKKHRKKIRARDNANQRKNRKEHPEKYRKAVAACKERKRDTKIEDVTLAQNPDREKIITEIRHELEGGASA